MSTVRRHKDVPGHDGRTNDIFFAPPTTPAADDDPYAIVFFGGDVQDGRDAMLAHRDNRRHAEEWSLERTAARLAEAHPGAAAVAIRPSRMTYGTFSAYQNFVESDSIGCPTHGDDHGAVMHLLALLGALETREGGNFKASWPKKLVGFSKGVVVLNQPC